MTTTGADPERPGRARSSGDNKKAYEKDPFYQDLTRYIRRNYRARRKGIDNARRRYRWATDPEFRDRVRARRYGLTLAQFRALLEQQGHACAICRRTDRPLALDHCHATGKVRGFLCRKCNVGLGHYDDDPNLTRAATAYLEATGVDRSSNVGDERDTSSAWQDPDMRASSTPER